MSRYKLNVFHWHLMDDQEWLIQIKKLTGIKQVDAWRVARTGHFNSFELSCPGERAMNGGYYKQEHIREIVAYSKRCFIIIVPEIDDQGYSIALIGSYPNLSSTKKKYPTEL